MSINRIETLGLAGRGTADGGASSAASSSTVTFRAGATGPGVAVFAPLHYEPNYRYPLLVWLHGPRDSEQQLKRIMPLVSMRNYVAVAPRGPCAVSSDAGGGWSWGSSPDDTLAAVDRVNDAVRFAAQRFNVNPRRVFLGGYDVGGTMAFRVALHAPESFGGAISVGGPFPAAGRPLSGINRARRLSVLIACGRESQRYPSATVCRDLRLLHSAGLNVTLRQYPGGHDLSPQILGDLDRWLMEEIALSAVPAGKS